MSEEINDTEHDPTFGNQEEFKDSTDYPDDGIQQETITKVTGMYKEWFLDYASYVILGSR